MINEKKIHDIFTKNLMKRYLLKDSITVKMFLKIKKVILRV